MANAPPTSGEASIGMFKPGTPTDVTIATLVPDIDAPCPEDVNFDDTVDVDDLVVVILSWGNLGDNPADVDGSGEVDIDDLLALILAWGPCE